eukprot:TRINITY_DN9263_c0_g1_i2.p1 TRINITY_DN9263_c0_g1~~TRINITY_DN9263_c0_g1_i2.p1  ORF type:complete len:295 (+),score=43.92 TRINITY_DN9263_c0_g1_i2:75-959(+)
MRWISTCFLCLGGAVRVEDALTQLQASGIPPAEDTFSLVAKGAGAVWRADHVTSFSAEVSTERLPPFVEYKGSREGWDASNHDFDMHMPLINRGFSVVFRRMRSNFYQKFAILPLGETDKKKSLYTVRMDTPHYGTGTKIWKVYNGYCKKRMGGLIKACNSKAAGTLPVRHVHCSLGYDQEKWTPGASYTCSWSVGSGESERPGQPVLKAEIFGGIIHDGTSSVKVMRANPHFWSNAEAQRLYAELRAAEDDDEYDDEPPVLQLPLGANAHETELFLTIVTALKQAFVMGGSGS